MSIPSLPVSSSVYASISLNWTDKLRLHQFPAPITRSIADQLRASWPPGIQAEQVYARDSYEYKLKGTPFGAFGAQEEVGSRRLVRDVLAFLYARGWTLVTPLSHSRHARSKDSLIFKQRRQTDGGKGMGPAGGDVVPPPAVEWLVVAPTGGDRLRVISDGPVRRDVVAGRSGSGGIGGNGTTASLAKERNHDELGVLVQSIKQVMLGLDYFQSGEWSHDSFEFKLKGYPWSAMGEKTVKVERLLLGIVETLDRFGWRSYATVRQRSDSDDVRKQDTWYFVRDEGWVPGSPFNGKSSSVEAGADLAWQ